MKTDAFGTLLRKCRRESRLTIAQLSMHSHIDAKMILAIEQGRHGNGMGHAMALMRPMTQTAQLRFLRWLCECIGFPLSERIGDNGQQE